MSILSQLVIIWISWSMVMAFVTSLVSEPARITDRLLGWVFLPFWLPVLFLYRISRPDVFEVKSGTEIVIELLFK